MSWEISANLGRHEREGVDARGWLWEITRGDRIARGQQIRAADGGGYEVRRTVGGAILPTIRPAGTPATRTL